MDHFQLAESIVCVEVSPGAERVKIACFMGVRIAQAMVAPNVGFDLKDSR